MQGIIEKRGLYIQGLLCRGKFINRCMKYICGINGLLCRDYICRDYTYRDVICRDYNNAGTGAPGRRGAHVLPVAGRPSARHQVAARAFVRIIRLSARGAVDVVGELLLAAGPPMGDWASKQATSSSFIIIVIVIIIIIIIN